MLPGLCAVKRPAPTTRRTASMPVPPDSAPASVTAPCAHVLLSQERQLKRERCARVPLATLPPAGKGLHLMHCRPETLEGSAQGARGAPTATLSKGHVRPSYAHATADGH